MSLRNGIDSRPQGARHKYTSADGAVVTYKPFVRGPGVLDVFIHKETTDVSGKYHVPRREYEGLEREWCDRQ